MCKSNIVFVVCGFQNSVISIQKYFFIFCGYLKIVYVKYEKKWAKDRFLRYIKRYQFKFGLSKVAFNALIAIAKVRLQEF